MDNHITNFPQSQVRNEFGNPTISDAEFDQMVRYYEREYPKYCAQGEEESMFEKNERMFEEIRERLKRDYRLVAVPDAEPGSFDLVFVPAEIDKVACLLHEADAEAERIRPEVERLRLRVSELEVENANLRMRLLQVENERLAAENRALLACGEMSRMESTFGKTMRQALEGQYADRRRAWLDEKLPAVGKQVAGFRCYSAESEVQS